MKQKIDSPDAQQKTAGGGSSPPLGSIEDGFLSKLTYGSPVLVISIVDRPFIIAGGTTHIDPFAENTSSIDSPMRSKHLQIIQNARRTDVSEKQ